MPVHPGGVAEKPSFVVGDAASARALVPWRGPRYEVSLPGPRWMDDHGATADEASDRIACRLSMLIVVNTAIVGLVATMVFAACEIATHIWA
jgi:hypothetical protein